MSKSPDDIMEFLESEIEIRVRKRLLDIANNTLMPKDKINEFIDHFIKKVKNCNNSTEVYEEYLKTKAIFEKYSPDGTKVH
jgi:chromatin remodeling complex protein RSC6